MFQKKESNVLRDLDVILKKTQKRNYFSFKENLLPA